MIAVDTNVLIHAHRAEMPRHEESLAAVRRLAEGITPWGLPVFALAEFVRVTTHPRILAPPSSLDEAFAALDALRGSPSCRILVPGRQFVDIMARLCRDHDLRGNRAFDAQIAAVCIENGVTDILTFDRDFDRIREMRVVGTL